MNDELTNMLRATGATPQVVSIVSTIRALVGTGSGVANLVASQTGDRGVILAVQWLDFFLGARPLPPQMSDEDLQKLADACVDSAWMESTGTDLATKVTGLLTSLLNLIPGAGGVLKQVADIVISIWAFARFFRNRLCSAPEIRLILASRPGDSAQISAAMPLALRRDWEAALRRRLAVERTLEQGEGRPSTPQVEAARRDDVASSEALLAAERLVLRFFTIAPATAGAPSTSVARRYIRRPPGYVAPPPTLRGDSDSDSDSTATVLYAVAAVGLLVYFLRR